MPEINQDEGPKKTVTKSGCGTGCLAVLILVVFVSICMVLCEQDQKPIPKFAAPSGSIFMTHDSILAPFFKAGFTIMDTISYHQEKSITLRLKDCFLVLDGTPPHLFETHFSAEFDFTRYDKNYNNAMLIEFKKFTGLFGDSVAFWFNDKYSISRKNLEKDQYFYFHDDFRKYSFKWISWGQGKINAILYVEPRYEY